MTRCYFYGIPQLFWTGYINVGKKIVTLFCLLAIKHPILIVISSALSSLPWRMSLFHLRGNDWITVLIKRDVFELSFTCFWGTHSSMCHSITLKNALYTLFIAQSIFKWFQLYLESISLRISIFGWCTSQNFITSLLISAFSVASQSQFMSTAFCLVGMSDGITSQWRKMSGRLVRNLSNMWFPCVTL